MSLLETIKNHWFMSKISGDAAYLEINLPSTTFKQRAVVVMLPNADKTRIAYSPHLLPATWTQLEAALATFSRSTVQVDAFELHQDISRYRSATSINNGATPSVVYLTIEATSRNVHEPITSVQIA